MCIDSDYYDNNNELHHCMQMSKKYVRLTLLSSTISLVNWEIPYFFSLKIQQAAFIQK